MTVKLTADLLGLLVGKLGSFIFRAGTPTDKRLWNQLYFCAFLKLTRMHKFRKRDGLGNEISVQHVPKSETGPFAALPENRPFRPSGLRATLAEI